MAETVKIGDVIPDLQAAGVFVLQLRAAPPDHHHPQQQQREQGGDIAAVRELAERGDEEDRLDRAEDHEHEAGEYGLPAQLREVDREQQGRHQHGEGDGQAVGRLDTRAGAEVKHHQAAADPEDVIDDGDIELTLGVRRVTDLQVGQQVEQNGLGHQRVGAGDERLGSDDGRERAEHDGHGAQHLGQHHVEGVDLRGAGEQDGIGAVLDNPGALAEVVEDQAELDEGPAGIDVLLADVPHVGIQSLRAGGGEEDAAEDHEAGLVGGAEEHLNGVDGVEGLEHHGQRRDVHHAGDAEEAEPDEHHRTEGLADAAGAGVLDGEEQGDDEQGDDDHRPLADAQQLVHRRNASQTLDRSRDGDGRGEQTVREQCGAAQHGREDERLAVLLDERVEREDAALAMVVRLHGDQHVFDRGQQRDRPDNEGERANDKGLIHCADPAVALEDRLHNVHRRGADITVDDADGYEDQAEPQPASLLFHRKNPFYIKEK